ncbi:MAG: 23S rRNA (pseudouridine(1915)-N(3))-methyltransferase RlmH, partial [Gammaproteobacteria bacterium]|nr:23S rRNA (pseudouridine(1915)-N(3))-methyltransferase RlmH [Gammaproteobacteria bacterium]
MQIQVINVAQRLPAWAELASDEYLRRMPRDITPKLVTIPLARRRAGQPESLPQQQESLLI